MDKRISIAIDGPAVQEKYSGKSCCEGTFLCLY